MNDLEIAPATVVKEAAHGFAAVLAELQQFKTFEQLTLRFRQDEAAQKDMQAYQQKQQSLRVLRRLNAVSPVDQAEWNASVPFGFRTIRSWNTSQPRLNWWLFASHWVTCCLRKSVWISRPFATQVAPGKDAQ